MPELIAIAGLGLIGYLATLIYKGWEKRQDMKANERDGKPLLCFAVLAAVFLLQGCSQVEEGERGIRKIWGKVSAEAITPGIYFYEPFSTSIDHISVRETVMQDKTEAFTSDTQRADVAYAVMFYPDPASVSKIYSQYGKDGWIPRIKPAVLNSLKDVTGQYQSIDLIHSREKIKTLVQAQLSQVLAQEHVILTRFDILNLDFDKNFEEAVEQKVVALQHAQAAINHTVQIEEEAKQKIKTATAEAQSMKIKSDALSQNKGLVAYEAVLKWDGKLPHMMTGNAPIPFLNLDKNQ